MATPATTMRIFAAYLFVLSLALMTVPALVLEPFGVPVPDDAWIRVVGMLAGFLGYYYWRAAAANLVVLFRWTVQARLTVPLFFGAFVAAGLAPASLVVFGVVDALAALWTWAALRAADRQATPA